MPALTLAFISIALSAAAAHAAVAIGTCLCSGNDDDRALQYSYYSSSSSYSSTSRIQTQPSYRPPPLPPPYTYRPPATHAQTTPRTPALPDYGCGAYHPSVVSPYTRIPSQTQPSFTRIQTSSTLPRQSSARPQPSVAQPASTSSRVPSRVPTERDPLLPTASSGVYRSSVVSPYTRTSSQKQPSSTLTPAPTTFTQPSTTLTRLTQPPSVHTQPSSTLAQPSSTHTQPSSTLTPPSRPHASFFEHILTQSSSTSSRVPSYVPTDRDLPTVIQVVSFDLRSDVPASVEDLDFAKKLREQARRRCHEMWEARSRAKSAQKKRLRAAAQEHNQRANAHQSAMIELDKRAAEIIFREKNKVCSYIPRYVLKVVL
jgi:hypothetical protein